MNEENKKVIVLDEAVIDTELVKESLTSQAIAKLREDASKLTVRDMYDKEGYEAAKALRLTARDFRTSVVKVLKEVRKPAKAFQDAVVARENAIVAEVKEIEAGLQLQESVYDTARQAVEVPKTPEQVDADSIRALRDAIVAIYMPATLHTPEGARIVGEIRAKLNEALLVK